MVSTNVNLGADIPFLKLLDGVKAIFLIFNLYTSWANAPLFLCQKNLLQKILIN